MVMVTIDKLFSNSFKQDDLYSIQTMIQFNNYQV